MSDFGKNDDMAQLIPVDVDLDDLPSAAEATVVRSLLSGLDDSWVVIPNVEVRNQGRDHEIDIVAASPTRGVVVMEVKGGTVAVVDGVWFQNDRRCDPQPDDQIRVAKHALVRRLQSMGIKLDGLFIVDTVGLPDVHDVPRDGLGTALPRERIFDGSLLPYPDEFMSHIHPEHAPIQTGRFENFLRALKPTVRLGGNEGRASPAALRLIDRQTQERLDALRQLGAMQRVIVTGGPGTGKSWLVTDWARQAIARGDRTAVVCFNRPIAMQLAERLRGLDAVVATYHALIMEHLLPDHGIDIPPQAGAEFWDSVPTAILLERIDMIDIRFDTIIIDEAQDLRPGWLDSLEKLLSTDGRILMTGDLDQALYVEPDEWRLPEGTVEWRLDRNLRSAASVAKALQHLGGPPPLPSAPRGMKVAHLLAGGSREAIKRVHRRIVELVEEFGIPHSELLVLTTGRDLRSAIRESSTSDLDFTDWEMRSEGAVVCETVHRTKGLEATGVILVSLDEAPNEQLLFVGGSRAIWSLTLVGPRSIAESFGVPPM